MVIFFKGQIPLSNFYKIKGGGGCPRSVPSRQMSPLSLLKCGLAAPKIAEFGNFWYKFAPKGYTPLSDFLIQNLAWKRVSQVCTLTPNFTTVVLKMWVTATKIARIGNFWYIFAPKGYIHLSNFYKNLTWGGSPKSPQSR